MAPFKMLLLLLLFFLLYESDSSGNNKNGRKTTYNAMTTVATAFNNSFVGETQAFAGEWMRNKKWYLMQRSYQLGLHFYFVDFMLSPGLEPISVNQHGWVNFND